MSDPDLQRDIGRLEAKVEHLEKQVDSMAQKLDQLVSIAENARGGWKMLLAVGAAAGALGAFLAKFLLWLK